MSTSYAFRLVCVCFATFFLTQSAVAALLYFSRTWLEKFAGNLPARRGADVFFWARLVPALAGIFAVAVVCIPSFLWLEEETGPEIMGPLSLAVAGLGLAVWCGSIVRAAAACFRSAHYRRQCERLAKPAGLAGPIPVHVLDAPGGMLVLAGLFRPVLVVSRAVVETLSPAQWDAAASHERAHAASRDNLRRLLLLLSPGVLPFVRGFRSIEEQWSRHAEWAADERAAAGDERRSLALAEALVRVSRLGLIGPPHLLATPLLAESAEIEARVNRLLRPQPVMEAAIPGDWVLRFSAVALMLAAFAALLIRRDTMEAAHAALERLIH